MHGGAGEYIKDQQHQLVFGIHKAVQQRGELISLLLGGEVTNNGGKGDRSCSE